MAGQITGKMATCLNYQPQKTKQNTIRNRTKTSRNWIYWCCWCSCCCCCYCCLIYRPERSISSFFCFFFALETAPETSVSNEIKFRELIDGVLVHMHGLCLTSSMVIAFRLRFPVSLIRSICADQPNYGTTIDIIYHEASLAKWIYNSLTGNRTGIAFHCPFPIFVIRGEGGKAGRRGGREGAERWFPERNQIYNVNRNWSLSTSRTVSGRILSKTAQGGNSATSDRNLPTTRTPSKMVPKTVVTFSYEGNNNKLKERKKKKKKMPGIFEYFVVNDREVWPRALWFVSTLQWLAGGLSLAHLTAIEIIFSLSLYPSQSIYLYDSLSLSLCVFYFPLFSFSLSLCI